MIIPSQLQAYWNELAAEAIGADINRPVPVQEIREVNFEAGCPLLSIDTQGQRHILLPASAPLQFAEDHRSTGVHMNRSQWRENDKPVYGIDVVCLKPHLNDLFDLIAIDIFRLLNDIPGRPDATVQKVLNRWRELLSRDPGQLPDKAKIVGLLGELTVLHRLAELHPNALTCWTGPLGSRHDFSGRGAAIEVKSTMRRHGLVLTINAVDQLLPPDDGTLHLIVLRFEEAPMDGQSVGELISRLERTGVDRADLLRKLADVGFSPDVITAVDSQKFRLLESRQYLVDESFPRIIPTSFSSGSLPNGVISLTYDIDLSSVPPYPLTEDMAKRILEAFIGVLPNV